MSIGNWLRMLRFLSRLGNAVDNDLSGWIRVLPADPFLPLGVLCLFSMQVFSTAPSPESYSGEKIFLPVEVQGGLSFLF
jgi:hypothetical protein